MAIKSVYLPEPAIEADLIRISGDEHRHLMVARAEAGEAVEIFNGKGELWSGIVTASTKRETAIQILEKRVIEPDPFEIVLGLSLIRMAAFELALEKAVEVGVTRILPVLSSRSNVHPTGKTDRWMRIVVEAAKQSKRYFLPVIEEPLTFDQVLSFPAKSRILLAERGGGPLASGLMGTPILYLAGPEGGWTDAELDSARRASFTLVSLGSSILRTETAAIVGAALIRYELQKSS